MKLHKILLLGLMFNMAAAFHPRGALPAHAQTRSLTRLSLVETYACSLNVWNKEIRAGAEEVRLAEFHLLLRAKYLGRKFPQNKEHSAAVQRASTFRLKRLDLQYFDNWDGEPGPQSRKEEIAWDNLRIRAQSTTDEELPIRTLQPGDTLTQIVLHSTIPMGRNDLMRIGVFEFQPQKIGVYELHFQLQRKNETTFEARQLLEVYCPPERPRLSVLKAEVLHQMRIPFMNIPLVASTFFEPGAETWNRNPTDRVFRSAFWGVAAKRMACRPIEAQLLLLDDPSSSLSAPARAELAARRAAMLLRFAEEKAALFQDASACEKYTSTHREETNGHAHASACATGITIQTAWPAQSQVFIKPSESEVSPQWFAQENSVVPLVASLPAQRILFQPLQLEPLEDSDYVELRCENVLSASLLDCVLEAAIEVKNQAGERREQRLDPKSMRAILRGEQPLRLRDEALQDFLNKGEFTARLLLRTSFDEAEITSNTVAFQIQRRSIVRDEVFALSPYDRVDLIYTLDHERLSALSREILQTVRDSLSASKSELFVLITGHSDSLGEHRAGGLGRDYNLSLSFSRAMYLKNVLQDSLQWHAGKLAMPLRLRSETVHIPKPLRESVQRNINNLAIQEVFNRANCSAPAPDCDEQTLQTYLDVLIGEKARHFQSEIHSSKERPPTTEQVHANLSALRKLLPLAVTSLEFAVDEQQRYVHFISTGMGAAAPFYRRLKISEELREIFCHMGFRADEMPEAFFGNDAYPAGRLMNRRVELNVIW